MGQRLNSPGSISWLCFLLWAGHPLRATDLELSVQCFSDYETKLTCEWEVSRPANCSTELQLHYDRNVRPERNSLCVPENKRSSGGVSPVECVCTVEVQKIYSSDIFDLKIQAGNNLLWNLTFIPFDNVKPKVPGNLTIQKTKNGYFLLTWDNTYTVDNYIYNKLSYEVELWDKESPCEKTKQTVEYVTTNLEITANKFKNWHSYRARVRSKLKADFEGQDSDWSQEIEWLNQYEVKLEDRLQLGVLIFSVLILPVILMCYFSVIKVKREWWDQIPNPAHSHLTAIIVRNKQLSAWGKPSHLKDMNISYQDMKQSHMEKQACPQSRSWKTRLAKIFPCLLRLDSKVNENTVTVEKNRYCPGPNKSEDWLPESYRAILMPESISVVQSVEMREAEVESEKEDTDDISFCLPSESSTSSFMQNKEAITAMLVQSLFLDLVGSETNTSCGLASDSLTNKYKNLPNASQSVFSSASQSDSDFKVARKKSLRSEESFESGYHSSNLDNASPNIKSSPAQSGGLDSSAGSQDLDILEVNKIIMDNPAYRSFSALLAQSKASYPEEAGFPTFPDGCLGEPTFPSWEDSDMNPEADCHGPAFPHSCSEGSDTCPSSDDDEASSSQTEEESWEQILRQSILRQQAAPAGPAVSASSGYRCFENAVRQGNVSSDNVLSLGVPEDSEYKSFTTLLNRNVQEAAGISAGESWRGEDGCVPSQHLAPSGLEAQGSSTPPLFSFGLDFDQGSSCGHPPTSFLELYSSDKTVEEENLKNSLSPSWTSPEFLQDTLEGTPAWTREDSSNGIIYSALTCHLCGHLKKFQSEDRSHKPGDGGQSVKCSCTVPLPDTPTVSPAKAADPYPSETAMSPESLGLQDSLAFPRKEPFKEGSSRRNSSSLPPKYPALKNCQNISGSIPETKREESRVFP
ncbi:interleukin-4 receptor subunit alpha isoform X2 [Tachyglossus aculeatus]|uniref:interleukin-4 receptor subunit alpha isoform X2 n=1 Tax=Tachyglossus aculeatus TaxID=9261 RepID=UPI0018F70CF1|nr:interleukin-4 receptor subunit alpha isoform X2 [Tachyglossus aculeatus]